MNTQLTINFDPMPQYTKEEKLQIKAGTISTAKAPEKKKEILLTPLGLNTADQIWAYFNYQTECKKKMFA